MIGQTLGHYRVESKVGQGGMGVVYRAIDTRLHRKVAIKVLPPEAVADAERKKRFIREARAASALNHPNIVTIHEIDTAPVDGRPVDFIVMEYVEGKTLDQIAARKRLPIPEALKYAVQTTDALAAAHRAGIVHRDIKPGNIMVSDSGLVKVLDFGVAKLAEPASASDATRSIDAEDQPRTEEGTVVGTVAYMSPEQAQGKLLDGRSDIFSFGSVLYELITGHRAFQGENKMATLSQILTREPAPLSSGIGGVPPELERIVARCLRKDPARRFQHVEDLKIALEELKEESESGRLASGQVVHSSRRKSLPIVIAACVAAASATAFVVWWAGASRSASPGIAMVRLTSDSGLSFMPSLSPDGKLVAFASDRGGDGNMDIWVKQVAGGEPIRLTRHPTADIEPAFSPDGTRIAFRSERDGRGIYVISALGGDERLLASQGYQPRWSPDGRWISYGINTPTSNLIYIVPATGGPPKQLRPEFASARPPVWVPEDQRIIFRGARDGKDFEWWAAPMEGGEALRIRAFDTYERMRFRGPILYPFGIGSADWPSGWWRSRNLILFSTQVGDNVNIWGMPISLRTWHIAGDPQQLTFGSGTEIGPSVTAEPSSGDLLAFASVNSNADVWNLLVDHALAKSVGEIQRVTRHTETDFAPFTSGDGQRLAFLSRRSGAEEVWFRDATAGEQPVTANGRNVRHETPLVARDGSQVAYTSYETPSYELSTGNIYVAPVRAPGQAGVPQRVCERCGETMDWAPDGRKILYRTDKENEFSLGLLDLKSRQTVEVIRSEHTHSAARLSPDGNWLLFVEVFGPVEARLWVVQLRQNIPIPRNEWILVSEHPSVFRQACWSPTGDLVYFNSNRDTYRCIWAQRLDPQSKRPRGSPFPVQHFHGSLSLAMPNPRQVGLTASHDRLFLSLVESTGNIWMTKVSPR